MLPAVSAAKRAMNVTVASKIAKQIFTSASIYSTDSDDTYPLAMYQDSDGKLVAWFGKEAGNRHFDRDQGIVGPYFGGKIQNDPSHQARPYLGDMSGFGYNYGFIGSDFTISGDYSHWPNCWFPSNHSSIGSPSQTIVFASSAFFNAPWLQGGDGNKYDFGFIDSPSGWNGNPNMDFRHFESRQVDETAKRVTSTGKAICVFADGHTEPLRETQIKDSMFQRDIATP